MLAGSRAQQAVAEFEVKFIILHRQAVGSRYQRQNSARPACPHLHATPQATRQPEQLQAGFSFHRGQMRIDARQQSGQGMAVDVSTIDQQSIESSLRLLNSEHPPLHHASHGGKEVQHSAKKSRASRQHTHRKKCRQ